MSGNLDSLRSNPGLSAPMTIREIERRLMHLDAKVRFLEAQAKWFVTRANVRRIVAFKKEKILKQERERLGETLSAPDVDSRLCGFGCGLDAKHKTRAECVAALRRSVIALERHNAELRKERQNGHNATAAKKSR